MMLRCTIRRASEVIFSGSRVARCGLRKAPGVKFPASFPRAMSTGGSGQGDNLDDLSLKELQDLVVELRKRLPAVGTEEVLRKDFVQIEAPGNYLKPTKGESSDLKNITIVELQRMRDQGLPITMATAYDFPSAVHVDMAGLDVVLVGDSVGMVVLGYETTLPVTFEEILHHCRAVSRGCRRPLLVGDMPFGSYEISPCRAQEHAYRLLKEGGMEAVKLEGCDVHRLKTVETLVNGGIAVMGHIGLTPQSYSTLGGFRAQGRHAKQAVELIENARRLEGAGVFAMVVECVPEEVARALTEMVSVPVIGIGAGGHTNGQVLVYHDLLGMMQHPHHAKVTPKFCKQYSAVGATINEALRTYAAEVRSGAFPGEKFSPYKMAKGEREIFEMLVEKQKAEIGVRGKQVKPLGGWGQTDSLGDTQLYGTGFGQRK